MTARPTSRDMTARPTSRSAEIADLEERLSQALGREKAAYARAAELRKELVQKARAMMEAVEAAVRYLANRIESGTLGDEFTGSTSTLDARRGSAGFGYGKGGSVYDPARSRRVFWTWSALTGASLSPRLETALSGPVKDHELYYKARGELCKRG